MSKLKFSPLISVIVVIAFIAGGYFLVKSRLKEKVAEENTVPNTETEGEAPKLIDRSLITERIYKEPDTYAVFDIVYPQFKNAGAEFNKKIEDLVMEGVAFHKEVSADNWQSRFDTKQPGEKIGEFPKASEKYSLSISWKPTQVNNDYVSILLIANGYTGGAHGYKSMISFNYNVADKEEVTLAELFPSDSKYLETISEFSREDLEAQFRKVLGVKTKEDEKNLKDSIIPMLLLGTEPDEINFSTFTFTKDSATFYFAEYQVAPYAMGTFKITMPR